MPFNFTFEANDASQTLMKDCFAKLCKVPFPVEAANAPVVMHYEDIPAQPSLVFLVNASIHQNRVSTPAPIRIRGVSTKKYSWIYCTGHTVEDVAEVTSMLNGVGYYAYTAEVGGLPRLYITWDERVISATTSSDEEE